MRKNAYQLLILLLILLGIVLVMVMVFDKDYGFDAPKKTHDEKILGLANVFFGYKNVTLDGIDYLQTQIPLGKFGGNFTTSILGDPKTFNPYNANDATSVTLSEIMYDGLLQTNPKTGEIIPKLAKSYKTLSDNKTYIIELRHGIKWSDGKEITSEDVYFTYNDIIFKGLGEGSAKDVMVIGGQLPSIYIVDKYTVKFTTPKPFAPFLRNLSASIVPKHIFEPVVKKGNEYFLTYQGVDVDPKKLVVSGAFKLSEYVPSQRVVYTKNPDYYLINKNDEKLPYIDKWIVLIVGDMNNQTLKFEAGATDTLDVTGSLLERYKELKKRGDFELYNLGPTTNTTFVVFNLNNRKNKEGKYYVDPKKQRWFQDRNFRSAIDWAINREDLVLNIFSGLAEPLYSAEPINSMFLNEKVAKGHPCNLETAKQYLFKSGFYYKDDKLYDKLGNRVEFELLTNAGNTQREASGVSIKQDLERLGIKINFKAVEFNSMINRILNSLDWDCIILAFTSNILEPNAGYNVWTPNASLHIFNKRSPNDDPKTDVLLPFEKELSEIFDEGAIELNSAKRKLIYDRYQEIIARENPLIYLYAPTSITAVRKKVKNIYPTKIGGLIYNIAEIYIDK